MLCSRFWLWSWLCFWLEWLCFWPFSWSRDAPLSLWFRWLLDINFSPVLPKLFPPSSMARLLFTATFSSLWPPSFSPRALHWNRDLFRWQLNENWTECLPCIWACMISSPPDTSKKSDCKYHFLSIWTSDIKSCHHHCTNYSEFPKLISAISQRQGQRWLCGLWSYKGFSLEGNFIRCHDSNNMQNYVAILSDWSWVWSESNRIDWNRKRYRGIFICCFGLSQKELFRATHTLQQYKTIMSQFSNDYVHVVKCICLCSGRSCDTARSVKPRRRNHHDPVTRCHVSPMRFKSSASLLSSSSSSPLHTERQAVNFHPSLKTLRVAWEAT